MVTKINYLINFFLKEYNGYHRKQEEGKKDGGRKQMGYWHRGHGGGKVDIWKRKNVSPKIKINFD